MEHALISKAVGRYRSYKSSLRPNHRPSDDDFYHSWQGPNNLWDIDALMHHDDPGMVRLSLETVVQFVDQAEERSKAYFDEDRRITHQHPWGRYNNNVELKGGGPVDPPPSPPSFEDFKLFMEEENPDWGKLLGSSKKKEKRLSF